MLKSITLKNFLLIEEAVIEFGSGFTAITGETGVGKTLVVDGLSLLLGGRFDTDSIRKGVQEASVEAVFESDGRLTHAAKTFNTGGRSQAWLDKEKVSAQRLKESVEPFISIHTQHKNTEIFEASAQLEVIDVFSRGTKLLAGYKDLYQRLVVAQTREQAARSQLAGRERELSIVRHQIREIDADIMTPALEEELTQRLLMLENASKIKESVQTVLDVLDEGDRSILDGHRTALCALRKIEAFDQKFIQWASDMTATYETLSSLAREASSFMHELSFSQEEYDEAAAKIDRLEALKKKYGSTVQGIIETRDALLKREQELDCMEDSLKTLECQVKELLAKAQEQAQALHEKRTAAAQSFEKKIQSALQKLGMDRCEFKVSVEQAPLGAGGITNIRFLIKTIPDQPFKPIEEVVSGGELSRIVLAVTELTAVDLGARTIVYDEVDVNIGGMVAALVGEKLKTLSKDIQIICVTHMPQIARCADIHFTVVKNLVSDTYVTRIVPLLTDQDRGREYMRMMGQSSDVETGAQR